ncbi:MAG: PRC-barrel domain-containing protein [Desulfosporosinus sp.]
MKPSKKYLSLPIISLKEGQQIGYVKSLILDAGTKALAAIVVDMKGFFKDQRIIPYSKIVSVGEDAITIDKESHVEKTSSLPELLNLVKEKLTIIGTKMVTETGKTLGIADEYYIDPETGKITQIEISGGKIEGFLNGKALMSAEYIITIGHDVIITQKGSENTLTVADKGLSDSLKSLIHSTSHLASETTQNITSYFKKRKVTPTADKEPIILPETEDIPPDNQTASEIPTEMPTEIPTTKVPLG